MKNVTVTWELPTVRASGKPLDPADLLHTSLEIQVDGAPSFTPVADILATEPSTFTISDVDIGPYIVRLFVEDKTNKTSTPVDTPFTIPDESDPGPVVNVAVSLS